MALLHYMKLPIFLLILGPLETKSFDTNTNTLRWQTVLLCFEAIILTYMYQ